jgi:hypothetical protein
MTELADVVAFFYRTDLETLERLIPEAARILVERESASKPLPADLWKGGS